MEQSRIIEKDLNSWEEFQTEAGKLESQYAMHDRLLFRGVGDSRWKLTTTLERTGFEGMLFADYYRLVTAKIKPAVETFTGIQWKLPVYGKKIEDQFRDPELLWLYRFPKPGFYRYLIYLRHHRFPSPLLDWSESQHVATFFAFRDQTEAEKRSIYVYSEQPTESGVTGETVGETTIHPLGPYVRSHARHFRQRSRYTICGSWSSEDGWRFRPHEPAVGARGRESFVWKFNLPSSERDPVLQVLDSYNLNAFSLFDSEEALLEMLWLREKVLASPTRK